MINIFRKVVRSEDFLSMSVDDLEKLIACNDLIAFEKNVSKVRLVIGVLKINLSKRANIYILI